MSADTTPISPARFAAALSDLSVEMLHLKVLEIRNSIAHLQYSNDQLRPFAEGTSQATAGSTDSSSPAGAAAPDPDCVEAIRENEAVIDRMAERIALVRIEVENRGVSWDEFQSKDEVEAAAAAAAQNTTTNNTDAPTTNGNTTNGASEGPSNPWTDGTFQTGTIRNGEVHLDNAGAGAGADAGAAAAAQGGSLDDEALRRAMEERLRSLDDEEEGMHL